MSKVIVNLSARSVSAQNTANIYGAPPPSAYHGFIKALLIKATGLRSEQYSDSQWQAVLEKLEPAFMVVVHDFRPRATEIVGEFLEGNKKRRSPHAGLSYHLPRGYNSSLDSPRADLRISLVFDVPVEFSQSHAEAALANMRLAGGPLEPNWSLRFAKHQAWAEALQEVRKCYGRGSLMREHVASRALDSPDALLDELQCEHEKGRGWVMPTLVGYQLLHDPVAQEGMRPPAERHAYADPLIGLVYYQSIYRFVMAQEREERVGWRVHYPASTDGRLIIFGEGEQVDINRTSTAIEEPDGGEEEAD